MDNVELYHTLFNAAPDATLVVDVEGNILMVNQQAERLFGYDKNEMLGNKIEMLIPAKHRKEHQADRESYSHNPVTRQMGPEKDVSGRKKDGSEFMAEITLSPVKVNGTTLIASSIRNVTDRKEKDIKLLENEKQFRHTLDNLLELVVILDHDMRYLYINKAGIEQTRLSKEQLLGKKIENVFPGFELTELYKVYRACLDEKNDQHLESEFTFPDGSKAWLEIRVQSIPEGIFVLSIDRTAKWKAQQKVAQQKKFFEAILNNLPADIAVFNKDHEYVFLNPKAIKNDELRNWLVGKTDFDYTELKGLDTSIAEKRRALFNKAVTSKKEVDWVDEYSSPQGPQFILRRMYPYFESNELIYVIGYGIDITLSKEAEVKLQQLYSDLKNANKELEQFSYMVSHDLQEPLRMVTGFLNLLKLETQDLLSADAQEYIRFASDGAERMKDMIRDLLQYSRIGTSQEDFIEVDLNEVIKYVKHILKERIQETSATVSFTDLGKISGVETLLTQLFMNVLSNALKYHGDKPPEIEIGAKDDNDHRLFYVKDNGIGIDPKFFEKIFGIFHRLHARNEYTGTGLGLAICKKIVEKHGGRIWVESAPGEGTTFYFTLLKRCNETRTENPPG